MHQDVWTVGGHPGLNGYIPVRDMTKRWGPSSGRNVARRKTECARRKVIVDLVSELFEEAQLGYHSHSVSSSRSMNHPLKLVPSVSFPQRATVLNFRSF